MKAPHISYIPSVKMASAKLRMIFCSLKELKILEKPCDKCFMWKRLFLFQSSWEFLGTLQICRVLHHNWYNAVASQIFSVDFILFLFPDYYWEINILKYSTKSSEIMPWTMEEKSFVWRHHKTKYVKIVQATYRRKFNFNTFPN